jgi:hypothetical protein
MQMAAATIWLRRLLGERDPSRLQERSPARLLQRNPARLREEDIPIKDWWDRPRESLWDDMLCEDVQRVILTMLDPLASLLFALTNKGNYALVGALPQPRHMDTEERIFRYGTIHLVEQTQTRKVWTRSGLPGAYAAQEGNLTLLKWMHDSSYAIYSITADYAAMGGQLHVMQWLKEVGKLYWTSQTLQQAVMHGSVENLEWMVANGCPETHIQDMCALKKGHLPVLKWLYKRGHGMYRKELLPIAKEMNRPDIVQWIEETLPMTHPTVFWEQEFDLARGVALPDADDNDI